MKHSAIRIFLPAIGIISAVWPCEAAAHSEYYHQRVALFEMFPSTEKDIIFLGNSIANGCEWAELFANPDIKNRGINGDTSVGVRDRLASTLKGHPAKVFLMIGVNDIANGASTDSVISVMKEIITQTRVLSPKTTLYVESILPVNDTYNIFYGHMDKSDSIREYNRKLADLCREESVRFIDLYPHFLDSTGERMDLKYTNDGLHLMGEGYRLWKNLVQPYITE